MSRKEYPKEVYETLILGGEGETPGVQVNLPWVLKQGESFTACHAYLGPGYCSKELARVCRNGFCPPPKPSTFIDVGENLEIKIEDYQENE